MRLAYDLYHPPADRQQNLAPVVMLHGIMDSRKTWKYIAPRIAEDTGRIVFALDARNHGDSQWTSSMSWPLLVQDLLQFLSEHRIRNCVLVGHSMGGRVAMTTALHRPELVEKLLVEDMSPSTISTEQATIVANLLSVLRESLQAIPPGSDDRTAKLAIGDFLKSLIPEGHFASLSDMDLDMVPLKRLENGAFVWQANLDVLEDFLTTPKIEDDLSKDGIYTGDALFLHGAKSFFRVEQDALIPKLFPRAILSGLEASHVIHHEKPSEFTTAVINFIKGGVPSSKY